MDYREIRHPKVYKDFAAKFDCNSYTAPSWTIGKRITLKADQKNVTLFYKEKIVAVHTRSWKRKERIEIPTHSEHVKKMKRRIWKERDMAVFISLGKEAEKYLEGLANAKQPLRKTVIKLLALKDKYGKNALIQTIKKANDYKAYRADYIENILLREMPESNHQPVKLKNDALNRIRLEEPMLEDYDAIIIKKRRQNNDC